MPDSGKLILFFSAAVLLAIAPGPGMLYVLARSLAGGRREGVLSACGTFVGGLVHVVAAGLGLSVILAKSAVAFTTVRYVGAAYLCYLGIRMILEVRTGDDPAATVAPAVRNSFLQGVATEVLNPKTGLFFLSFVPQFVSRNAEHILLQFVALGTTSVLLNTSADLMVILLAAPLGNRIRSSSAWRCRQRKLTGFVMIGLGTYLATSDSH